LGARKDARAHRAAGRDRERTRSDLKVVVAETEAAHGRRVPATGDGRRNRLRQAEEGAPSLGARADDMAKALDEARGEAGAELLGRRTGCESEPCGTWSRWNSGGRTPSRPRKGFLAEWWLRGQRLGTERDMSRMSKGEDTRQCWHAFTEVGGSG